MIRLIVIAGFLLGVWWITPCAQGQSRITVGAKNFTEQEILAELVAQLIERHTDLKVVRRFGLGGTGVCHAALLAGELDMYVEYTGTALLDILQDRPRSDPDEVLRHVWQAYRERFDLEWLAPIGFNNSYAMAVRAEQAEEQGWEVINDLVTADVSLRGGFTSEFIERSDGYPGLRRAYGLELASVIDLDPGLMYQALASGQVDVISGFATDGRIVAYKLRVLEDDRAFSPPYHAAPVVRGEVLREHPELRAVLMPLAGTISNAAMRKLNHAVDVEGKRPALVAREWLDQRRGTFDDEENTNMDYRVTGPVSFSHLLIRRRAELGRKTLEHLGLTGLAMLIAIVVGVPLGILIHRYRRTSNWVLAGTEIVQTIPSLAMLAFLFALYKVLGMLPAVSALVLYALLPIVLNTFTGLKQIPASIVEAADGVGMSRRQRMWMVELPLALPVIVAGVRTATVWTVGIATLSTYIGAGGLGDFISRGLARNAPGLTLLGAIPAALMAVVLSLGIKAIERKLSKV
ncbi:MAG: ABC transporter permease subunit [Phycisphaerales bacterium]|nr:ABC transporter permease subunit [Phycisphaerales bacterium]